MKLASQLTVNASADHVWAVVAHDFAQIGDWASSVTQSVINLNAEVPDGATVGGRVCSVPGFGDIHETFVKYNEANKAYTYEATGMPFFVKKALNSWSVKALSAQTCEVRFQAELELMPIIGQLMAIPMRMQMIGVLNNATEELKYYVETGEIHPRKQALLAKSRKTAPAS